jgi:predicted transcriptional regulator
MGSAVRQTQYQYQAPSQDARRSAVKVMEQGLDQINQIWGLQQEIIRLYVLGFKEVDIAAELHINPQTVSNCVNSNVGRARILELQGGRDEDTRRISERLRSLRDGAIDRIAASLESGDERVALRAAETLLDRTGHGKIDVPSIDESYMSDRHIEDLNRRALERGWRSEAVIDLAPTAVATEDSL